MYRVYGVCGMLLLKKNYNNNKILFSRQFLLVFGNIFFFIFVVINLSKLHCNRKLHYTVQLCVLISFHRSDVSKKKNIIYLVSGRLVSYV